MRVDHERVLNRLRQELVGRQGIGVDALFALIGRLEAECLVDEGLLEEALRAYGIRLPQDLDLSGGVRSTTQEGHAPLAHDS